MDTFYKVFVRCKRNKKSVTTYTFALSPKVNTLSSLTVIMFFKVEIKFFHFVSRSHVGHMTKQLCQADCGGLVGCIQSWELGVRALVSEVHPEGGIQWHSACGFDFRHGHWLEFLAAFVVFKGLKVGFSYKKSSYKHHQFLKQ